MPHDPYAIREKSEARFSNGLIAIVALACFGALSGILTIVLGFDFFSTYVESEVSDKSKDAIEQKVEAPTRQQIRHAEYTFDLPIDYRLVSEETRDNGDLIVRYKGEDGCHCIFSLLTNDQWDRFTNPPATYAEAVIPDIEGLDTELDAELLGQRLGVGGMAGTLFQFYERETFRGIDFTYLLVAMHQGNKLVMKFGGKYKRYSENEEFVIMPDHWREYLLTLRPLLPSEILAGQSSAGK